jgi:DNA polymerase IV
MNYRIVLHLDMNSYFASVEQQANPFFRNKPVGVCAYLSKNGCIIASSIEAKKVGIKTGCRVSEAQKLYPKVILVENDPNKYRSVTKKIFGLLAEYTDELEPYSIDEAFLNLTGWVKDFFQAERLAGQIRLRIKQEIGDWLKCSIGISYTKFLAKLCSDLAEADQTKVFTPSDGFNCLYQGLKLTDIWGINKRLEIRLNNLGIFSLIDLQNYPVANLIQIFGRNGYWLWSRINGFEVDHLNSKSEAKSIGHSYCLPKWTTDKKYLTAILMKLCEKIGKRLLEKKVMASTIHLHWSYIRGSGYGRVFKVSKYLKYGLDIYQLAAPILVDFRLEDKIQMLAVSVSGLTPYFNQPSLFLEKKQPTELSEALYNLKSRFGENIVYQGKLYGLETQAVDRIGFRKIELD